MVIHRPARYTWKKGLARRNPTHVIITHNRLLQQRKGACSQTASLPSTPEHLAEYFALLPSQQSTRLTNHTASTLLAVYRQPLHRRRLQRLRSRPRQLTLGHLVAFS